MKQKDFEEFISDDLRDILINLNNKKYNLLPEKISNYVLKDSDNIPQRTSRCINLIKVEVFQRFYTKTL